MRRMLVLAVLAATLVPAASADAISRGRAVTPGEAPWLIAIQGRTSTACGGVLVGADRVLTAAHCVQGAAPGALRLRLGDGPLGQGRRLRVARIAFPPSYRLIPSPVNPDNPGMSGSVRDIAVLHLTARVTGVEPITIAAGEPQPGEPTTTYGRGRTGPAPAAPDGPGQTPPPDTGRGPSAPLAADQVVLADAACAEPYGSVLHASLHLCTEDATTGAQACGGDSGGPVVVRRGGQAQLAGLVTWGGEVRGRDCGEGLPDVSEQVGRYARLLTQRRAAPYAEARTRVRRADGVLECVSGPWHPGNARLRYTWYRLDGRDDVAVPGVTSRRIRARTTPLGCAVRASTAGGWAEERSYNQR